MHVAHEIISDCSELDRLAPEWEDLLSRASVDDPTVTPFWHLAWWDVFGSLGGRRLDVVAFYHRDQLVGVAPLVRRRHWYRPGIPLRRIELSGSGEPAAHEVCSEYNGAVAARGFEEAVARGLVGALDGRELGPWDELVLPALSADNALLAPLETALRDAGHAVAVGTSATAAYARLPETWDAYLAQLSSATRYLVRRSLRDLEAWAGGDVQLRAVNDRSDLRRGVAILTKLHGERWGEAGPEPGGVFRSRHFRAFHARIMHRLLERRALDLLWLEARGEPIAALYNFVWKGRVQHYQSGRRTDLPPRIRAGIAMHAYAIRRAIEAGHREYDFLGGDSRYKDQLATEHRPLIDLYASNGRVVELARLGFHRARAVKRRISALWSVGPGADAARAQEEVA